MNWIIEQEWNHVLFLHWLIDADTLKAHVPFELDLFQGKAVISIVPFQMNRIRFPYLPVVPLVSTLWELNLRTYVNVGGVTGVYFFTLDTDSALGSWIANWFFHLPYRLAKMEGQVSAEHYLFESERSDLKFQLTAKICPQLKNKTDLDRWATDRVHLFTRSKTHLYQGTVIHSDWRLQSVRKVDFVDRFSCQLPIHLKEFPDEMAYCRQLKVRFKPFLKKGFQNENFCA